MAAQMSTSITKFIRLAAFEAEELHQVARQTSISESALMKKWVLEGVRAYKLERAILAYIERKTDLRGGASLAAVSYNRFLHEIQKRNIVILDDANFLHRLGELADTLGSDSLRQTVDAAAADLNSD